MEFRDLKLQYQSLKKEIDAGIQSVISSSAFILGSEVAELEGKLADYVGTKHCISCANGTDALILALMAYGIGAGDAVFVPDFTFAATASAVAIRGATPIMVDIDLNTFNLCPISLEKAIQRVTDEGKLKPSMIIPVDLFGLPANYPAILAIAGKHGLLVLEDGAQGFGGAIGDKKVCSFGDVATTSFFPAKPLGCYGDGGAIFTNNDELNVQLRSLRAQGRSPQDKYDNRIVGLNSRLDTLQAAILLPKLKAFVRFELDAVNHVADVYTDMLHDYVETPCVPDGYRSSWAQYTIKLKNRVQRDALQAKLKQDGIPSMVYYPKALHRQTVFMSMGCNGDECTNAEMAAGCVLSLPMHPYMDDENIKQVIHAIIR